MHLALHSNASPENLAGRIQGTDVFYYEGSAAGEALAQLIAANMRTIYPYPELVGITPNRTLYELRNTQSPTVLVEVAYHDNREDATWIVDHIDAIAKVMVLSLSQYFGVPFVEPNTLQRGVIDSDGYLVNVRSEPSWDAAVIGVVANGADVIITGSSGNWYIIDANGLIGYVWDNYVTLI